MVRCLIPLLAALVLLGQDDSSKQKIRNARELHKKQGAVSIATLAGYLSDSAPVVRREAVRLIVAAGTPASLDPLVKAAASDADAEVQGRAIGGLVNVYVPGYAERGNLFGRAGRGIKGAFIDANDRVVEHYVSVRPGVSAALVRLLTSGASLDVQASAARACGVLRARTAVPALVAAAKSKESALLYESLVALQKIGDASAAPGIAFLLQDLDQRVQVAAIETTGLLRNRSALPGLREALGRARNEKVRSAALSAISMIPAVESRPLYDTNLGSSEDDTRAAAAEGFARLAATADRDKLVKAFEAETKMKPRLAMAFASVMTGERATSEQAPLTYLLNTLNSSAWQGVASAYLEESARQRDVRALLSDGMTQRTRAEKTALATILARSGDASTAPVLEGLAKDPDSAVAVAGAQALRNLRARLTP